MQPAPPPPSFLSPRSPKYAEWMSQAEVADLTATDPAIRSEVVQWLNARGAVCTDMNSGLRCSANVQNIERAFKTQLMEYTQVNAAGTVKQT